MTFNTDDTHAVVKTTLRGVPEDDIRGLADLTLGELNETEAELAHEALHTLRKLDRALAKRSGFEETELADETRVKPSERPIETRSP